MSASDRLRAEELVVLKAVRGYERCAPPRGAPGSCRTAATKAHRWEAGVVEVRHAMSTECAAEDFGPRPNVLVSETLGTFLLGESALAMCETGFSPPAAR